MSVQACFLSGVYREMADQPSHLSHLQKENYKTRSTACPTFAAECVEQVSQKNK